MSDRSCEPDDVLGRFGLRRVDVSERAGRVSFADPFRQLEDEARDVRAWQGDMNAKTLAALVSIGDLDGLREEVAAHLWADRLTTPQHAGGRWFWAERDTDDMVRRVRVSDSLVDQGHDVIAADEIALDGEEIIEWHVPSPDGCLLAVGVSSHGDEQVVLAIVEVASGSVVGPRTRHVGSVAWLPDSSGLFLARGLAPSQEQPLKELAFLRCGHAADSVDMPPLAAHFALLVQVSPDGRYVGLAAGGTQPRLLYVYDRHTEQWSASLAGCDDHHVFFGVFVGDEYFAVTSYGAPRGRVVAAPACAVGERSRWRSIVDQGSRVIRTVTALDSRLLLYEIDDGLPQLRIASLAGGEQRVVELPRGVAIATGDRYRTQMTIEMPAAYDGDQLVFTASGLDRTATLWRYDLARDRADELTSPAMRLPPLLSETAYCSSVDGKQVRYELVRRADLAPDAPLPTLIHGYGGFNCASLPHSYNALFAPWIAAGGTFVFVHLRGDSTFGIDQWWRGRREHKQRTFDDLFAASEDLLARRLTTEEQLVVCGASNGGLLASVAIAQRPELFRAAAILIPMCDMNRLYRERFPECFRVEYGDPRVEEEAAWLRSYSPYHNLARGQRYPATMIVSGDRDMRTHAWHGRKMAAALRDAGTGEDPVLLRVHVNHGHLTTVSHPGHVAEWLGFLMAQVGLSLAQRDAGWSPEELTSAETF